ncbi:MAG: glutathione S-transferase [Alphaproteobacteria bacterium]|nr:glutathione S-transferase [Alphaproteobacteria bacterium]
MLQILGRNNSVNVQKVLWTCVELDIGYERTDIGGPFGGNDQPEYLAKNPNGLVPTVEDGDLVIWESNAIVRYLAAKHNDGSGFLPADPGERALAEQWMDWQLSAFWPPLMPVFIALVRTAPERRDMAAIDAGVAQTALMAAILDGHLARNDYLAGDRFTMGDVPVGGILYRWLNLDIERPDHPHLTAYYQRLCDRAGYREHVAIGMS